MSPHPVRAGGALASEEVRPVSLIPHEARTGRTLEPALIGSVCPEHGDGQSDTVRRRRAIRRRPAMGCVLRRARPGGWRQLRPILRSHVRGRGRHTLSTPRVFAPGMSRGTTLSKTRPVWSPPTAHHLARRFTPLPHSGGGPVRVRCSQLDGPAGVRRADCPSRLPRRHPRADAPPALRCSRWQRCGVRKLEPQRGLELDPR